MCEHCESKCDYCSEAMPCCPCMDKLVRNYAATKNAVKSNK